MVGRRFLLSPSPNWYATHATDVSEQGLLAYGAHNSIVIYDISESRIRGILHGHTNRVTAVAFAEGASGSQCLISGAADRSLRVWNVSSLSCTQTITKRPAEVSAITVAGKGNIIAIGDQGGNVSLWNLQKSRKPQKVQGLKCKSSISCMAAAPKANWGLTSTSSPYWQGDFSQSEGHRVVKQAPPPWVAIGCNDGSVCIVDVDHAELLCTLRQHRANVQSVSWAAIPVQSSPGVHNSAVSSVLASTSADGCIHTYSFPPWSGVPQSGTSQGAVASVMAVTATGVKSLELMTDRASACDQERAGLPHRGCSAEASMRAEAGCNREGAESMQAVIGREQAPTVEGGANTPITAGTSNAADPCQAVGGSVSSGSASVPGLRPGVIPSESRVETGGLEEVGISVAAEVTTKHELCTHDEMVSGATITEKPGWSSCKGGIELPRSYANPTMLCMLKLPPPPAGLSHGQKERLWVAATWVPMCCNKSLTSNHDHTWLLSSGYGGSLLAWHVPLVPGSRPPPPQRLPSAGGHSRTVFTLQSLCLLGAAAEPGLVTCLSAAQRTQQEELIHPRAWKEGTAKSKEVWESVTIAAVPAVSDLDSSRTVSPDGAHCRFEAAGHDSATRSPKQPDEGITHPQADCTAPVPPPPPPGEPPMHPPPYLGALTVPPESPSRCSSEVARGEMNGGPWGPMDAWKSSSWVPERSRAAQEGATGGEGPAFQETATSSWHPRVCVISTGLDRAVLQWQLPCLAGGKDALKHAQVTWGMTGLGGHAYALACSSPNSSMHSMLAVGCGDKSIRMLDLSGGQARARSQPSKLTNVATFPDETPAGGVEQHESGYMEHDDIMPAVTRGADTAHATELCDRDPCPAGGPSTGVQHAQQVLIWQGIPDKVTAVAWCPAEHAELGRLLAFGCQDGTVGVVKVGRGQSPAPCCPFSMKHKGPILELRWLLGSCFSALISLSADGTLLQWGPWEDPFQLARAAPHCKAGRKGQEGRGGGTSVCKEIAHSGQSMRRAGSQEPKRSSDNDNRAGDGQLPRDLGADLKQQAESQRTSQVGAAETEGARWHGDVASAVPDSQLTRQAASADRGQGLGVVSALDVSCRKRRNPCQIAVGCTDGSLSVFEENSFKSPQSSGRNSVTASSSAMTAESVVTKPFQCLIAGAESSQLDAQFHLSWTEAGFGGVAFTQVLFCPSDTRLLATADVLGSVAVHAVASGISEEANGEGLQGSFRLEAGDQALLSRVELGRQVTALSWHPLHRDRIACALSDFSIQVLALEGRQLTAGRKFRGHAGIVRGLAWHPAIDHLLLSGSEDQSVRQWSLLQQPQQQQRQHGGQVPAATQLTPAPSAHIAGPQRPDVPAHPSFDAPPPDNLCPASGDPVPPQHSALQVEPPIASESILPGPTVPAPGESAKGGAMVRSAEGPAGSLMGAPGPLVAKVEGASTAEVPGREAELQKGHPGGSASPPAPPAVAVSGGSGKRDREEERRDGSVAVEISGEARDLELGEPEEAATEKGARRGAPLFAPANKCTQQQQQQQQQQDLKCVAKQQEAAAEGSVPKGSRAAAGNSTKKSGGSASTLGRRQLLAHGVASAQQAQHGGKHPTPSANNHSQLNACLQLARGLLPAHIPPTETGGTCNTAVGPSTMGQGQFASTAGPPLLQEVASLVGCGPDPLTASFLLGKQAELLGQAAVGSKTFQSRHSMAQRSAALSLWRGDVGAALQTLLENNALTADFVSMSAAAGRPAWEAVVRVYATQLAAGGEPHLAALHLLSIGDVHAAVRVYREEGMLQEAVEVASARLLPQDPLLQELRRLHAAQLASKGLVEQAAAQYMAAGLWGSAAEALAGSATPGAVDAAREVCCLVMGGAPGEHEGSSKAPGPRETAVESLGAGDTTRTGTSTAADIASGAGEECSSSSTPPGERPPPCKAQAEGGKAPAAQLPPRELVRLRKAMARLEGAASGGTSPSSGARGAPHCGSPHPGSARPRRRYSLQELMLLSGSGGTCQLPPDVRELAARPGS